MNKRHEPHYVDATALHKLGGLFALLFVLVLCVMYVLWLHVHSRTLSLPPQVLPPQPRLQANPPMDRVAQYRLQAEQLDSYGWTDPSHRFAHIPIERAMALLAQQASSRKQGRSGSP